MSDLGLALHPAMHIQPPGRVSYTHAWAAPSAWARGRMIVPAEPSSRGCMACTVCMTVRVRPNLNAKGAYDAVPAAAWPWG